MKTRAENETKRCEVVSASWRLFSAAVTAAAAGLEESKSGHITY